MNSSQMNSQHSLLYRLQQRPEQWQFAQAIRVLLHHSQHAPVSLLLRSDPGYRYTNAELTQVSRTGNSWSLSATLPCLSGIQGVLPYGYQDCAHQLRVGEDDSGLQDFYEIFNQRILLNSYQAATRYRLTCRFEQDVRSHHGKDEVRQTLAEQLCSLAGIPKPRTLPAEHLARYIGLIGQKTSSTAVLEQILKDYFELPVKVSTTALRRHRLDDECRTALSAWRKETNVLGNGALMGRNTWLASNKVELVIAVQNREQKQRLQRDQTLAGQMREFCNLFLGHRVDIDIRLQCHADLLPRPQLSVNQSQAVQLGPRHSLQSGRKPQAKVLMTLGAGRERSGIAAEPKKQCKT